MRQYALLLLLICCGCRHTVHPGQVDALDGKTYDVLIVSQAVLDNAKIAFSQGKLPADSKPVINQTGAAYNLLRELWLEYRANPSASTAEKVVAATSAINQLVLQLRNMGVKGD